MPAWWSKKSHKTKQNTASPKSPTLEPISSNKESKSRPAKDGGLRRKSRDLGVGFSGFDSDGVGKGRKAGHPLPLPTTTLEGAGGGELTTGSGFGSGSVSSVSSSESNSDDHSHIDNIHIQPPFGLSSVRTHSPGPGSRVGTAATSPIHPRLAGLNLESPTERQGDGRSKCHPLPLPPNSPTSPSMSNGRAGLFAENMHSSLFKWKKGRLLGRGTFGHVYAGFNRDGGQMCAIKEVRIVSDDQNSKESLRQLNQEINLLNQLSHPNIVRYYGSELADDTLSVYLEYVSGGSIHKLLQEYGPFKEPVIQNYTRQILSGLAYLHSRNTVHRDIKGANILVDPSGEIKLADFGMAKHITSCTSVLSFKGSPYWMAPEVVMNTNGYCLAVDIWSLGCTIIEMAMAKPPWSQYEGVAAIFKIGNSKEIPEIPDSLSNDAKSFLKLCFQRDPSSRPSALQLLDHPFVKDQALGKTPYVTSTNGAPPFSFDGSHKPVPLDIQPRRKSISSSDMVHMDNMKKHGPMIWEARDNPRSITSLPVSPCSSPLRKLGVTSKSCLLSPPNPAYGWQGQSNYILNHRSLSPTRRRAGLTLDPCIEATLFKGQRLGGSSKTRLR